MFAMGMKIVLEVMMSTKAVCQPFSRTPALEGR